METFINMQIVQNAWIFLLLTTAAKASASQAQDFMEMMSNNVDKRSVQIHRTKRATDEGKVDTSKGSVTMEERLRLLKLHNDYRAGVSPRASNMEFMVWDPELEAQAQAWSDNCDWQHGQLIGIDEDKYWWVGQNLYTRTGSYHEDWAMEGWYNEVDYYDFYTGSCDTGEVCGHYTQIVWATSRNLGCGITYCPRLKGFADDAYYIVCNYGPGGNIGGQQVYEAGSSCSNCPMDMPNCENNLCRREPFCGDKACSEGSLDTDTCECSDISGSDRLLASWTQAFGCFIVWIIIDAKVRNLGY